MLSTAGVLSFLLVSPNVYAQKVIAGALFMNPIDGPAKLQALAANASNLPMTRLMLSFVRPDMLYIPGSKTLQYSNIGFPTSGDYGFAAVKEAVKKLQAGGIEVFLSMGGLNNNCFPYFYMKYSIAYFGMSDEYWKIYKYGNGSTTACTKDNNWCRACDLGVYAYDLSDLSVFPEPNNTSSFQNAQARVASQAKGNNVIWHPEIVGGAQYIDPADKTTVVTVPGSNLWSIQNRDPYQDFIYLAKDLGLNGVDLDYNEIWHADTFRSGSNSLGPFKLDQTVYKYSAIAYDIMKQIRLIYPTCLFSTTVSSVGAWQGNWWGGSLKGLWYYVNLWYPDLIRFITHDANAGGINVKSFDLSKNNAYYSCQDIIFDCNLGGQVQYFMSTYAQAGIWARTGYQVGQPSHPSPFNDSSHQLPLTQPDLKTILQGVSSSITLGGYVWELFKPKNDLPTGSKLQPNNLGVNSVIQQICSKTFPLSARCGGVIPVIAVASTTTKTSTQVTTSLNTTTATTATPMSITVTVSTTFQTSTRSTLTPPTFSTTTFSTEFLSSVYITPVPSTLTPSSFTITSNSTATLANVTTIDIPTTETILIIQAPSTNSSPIEEPTSTPTPTLTPTPSQATDDKPCSTFGEIICVDGISFECMLSPTTGTFIWVRFNLPGCGNVPPTQPPSTPSPLQVLLGRRVMLRDFKYVWMD
ncbi:hypothetical protein BCR33DRAFT_854898 [Rhizoclosmatium globosum]|uniref:Chitinase n=1 Tax=Rhizoclosmatium globosum TaxID=329046 RepID=A0A1Y2BSC5_9FUNG|nr:hypothetical protein BCR33DRAFT_854898 [Rhizoclosmatium globosum]|eukprot:ORY37025.1 hypothetical protein BCR33DRAFT_854898 [Rhizoclosmatium globosum]